MFNLKNRLVAPEWIITADTDTDQPGYSLPVDVRTLLNVADGATANASNAALRDRATHTGTQLLSSISDAGTAAASDVGDFATAAQGNTADSALQPTDLATGTLTARNGHLDFSGGSDGDVLTVQANGTLSVEALPPDAVTSVNAQTGAVILNADHIDDTTSAHKFATASQLSNADSALQPAGIASGTITPRADDIDFSGGVDGDVLTVQADGSLAVETPSGGGGGDKVSDGTVTPRTEDIDFSGGSDGDMLTVQSDGSLAVETPSFLVTSDIADAITPRVGTGIDFSGGAAGWVLTQQGGGWLRLQAPSGQNVSVEDEGSQLTAAVTNIDFVGAGVTATNSGADVTVTIPGGGGGSIPIEDEGSEITAAVTSINFVGAGVTATNSGDDVTVTIPGGAGGGDEKGISTVNDPASPYTAAGLSGHSVVIITGLTKDLTLNAPTGTFTSSTRAEVEFEITASGGERTISFGAGITRNGGLEPNLTINAGETLFITLYTGDGGTTFQYDGAEDLSAYPTATPSATADWYIFYDSTVQQLRKARPTATPESLTLSLTTSDPGAVGAGTIVRADRANWDPANKGSGGSYLVMRNDADTNWVVIDAQGG